MKIAIDLQGAQGSSTNRGLGRYALNFAMAMSRFCGKHEVLIILNGNFENTIESIKNNFKNILPVKNICIFESLKNTSYFYGGYMQRQIAEIQREAFIYSLEPDFVIIPSFIEGCADDIVTSIGNFQSKKIPVAVTIHDLIPKIFSNYYLKNEIIKNWYNDKINNLKKADIFFAVSECSKVDAIKHLQINNKKIVNTYSDVDSFFLPINLLDDQKNYLKRKFNLSKKFLIYPTAIEYRKNVEGLIKAFSKINRDLSKDLQLLIVGSIDSMDKFSLKNLAKEYKILDEDLVFTGLVSNEDLALLYNLSEMLVFPSFYEGFGLPILEAMRCGKPVIGSNKSSIPEIINFKEALFDPYDDKQITNSIERVLLDQKFKNKLIQNSLEQATKFSWQQTVKIALSHIENFYNQTYSKKNNYYQVSKQSNGILDDLIKKIKNLKKITLTDHEYKNLSIILNKNFPQNKLKKTIFVDISEIVKKDQGSGIQRVVKNYLREFLLNPPKNWFVEPVYMTDTEHYRYAKKFTQKFLNLSLEYQNDSFIDFNKGDIFFVLDLEPITQFQKREFYKFLRKHGVLVKFLVYDLICVLHPEFFGDDASENFTNWLKVVCENDEAICISKTTAKYLKQWIQSEISLRNNPLKITYNYLGYNFKNEKKKNE